MKLKTLPILMTLFTILFVFHSNTFAMDGISQNRERDIEKFISSNMKKGKIPGISVTIVKGNETVFQKGFGFSDANLRKPVTSDTLFELGSTSKAFTALGILELENKGLLNLNDLVTKYIPWLKMNFKGHPADIKLSHLLHHTSGIPFKTIGDIPIDDSSAALEKTVRALAGQKLDFMPGEKFSYATVNYDVLGLVIQTVSRQPYEEYIKRNVLAPLGLDSTYVFRQGAPSGYMSRGYKLAFLRAAAFDAPMYRGNTPAGYFITNSKDMAKWLKIQMGMDEGIKLDKQLIESSHLPDRTVSPGGDGSSYAAGWSIYQSGTGEISHSGNNPNFSSFLVFRPEDKIGVAVLANLNSAYTQTIGQGIMNILRDTKLPDSASDMYKGIDNLSSAIAFILVPVIAMILWFTAAGIIQAIKKRRRFEGNPVTGISAFAGLTAFMAVFGYCIYCIPDVLYWGLNWGFFRVWAPVSLLVALLLLFAGVLLFMLYFIFTAFFPKHDDMSLFTLTILSIVSGLGNAVIIFVVNETLNREGGFQGGLFLYMMAGIVVYVFGQRLVRIRLIKIANRIVYSKRMHLIEKILNTSYQKIESLEYGRIQASLNNDTETISEFSNIVITGATNAVTLMCCFVYLGIISFYGLLLSMCFIFIAAGIHFLMGSQANKLWEQTRDIQNIFFKFINDMISGFKELSLNAGKRNDFKEDMQASCKTYKEKRIKGDIKFANANVIGELLFSFVIGAVAFIFPVIFHDLKLTSLRTYIFVILYMTGPVHGILGSIPNIFKVRISWNRINGLSGQLDCIKDDVDSKNDERVYIKNEEFRQALGESSTASLIIELKDVEYYYKNSEGEAFTVGPVECRFKSGEITFITGGNGSGKSTLAKMVTGLYAPDSGEIFINSKKADSLELCGKYSAIFSDFHLFEKLYGIDHAMKGEEVEKYLKLLRIDDKVAINDGVLNTIKLSTGQRKRLALLVSYMEDRPVYLFDEWAADQDPEFRKFFYHTLLPDLKNRGKCVIAITHDDRYFNLADQVIKMELGKIVKSEIHTVCET
jgi:putative ATP-binding cassette transporter